MASHDKSSQWKRFLKGFGYAFSGLTPAIRMERNLKIHFVIAFVVIVLAFVFHLSYSEKLILLIVIGIVISLELVNTAVEHAVDLVTDEKHPLAKLAKDSAAAAVLFFSIISVIIAIAIFLHHILNL